MKCFASDNAAGVHPAVLEAIARANVGHAIGYGDDDWTLRAERRFRELLGRSVDVYFVYNGTGANTLSAAALLEPYQALVCTDMAHVNVDEAGAPERFGGCKVISVPSHEGRIDHEQLDRVFDHLGFVHTSQPGMVTITESTEVGTVYGPEEIRAIAEIAHSHGALLHIDGARIANAVASVRWEDWGSDLTPTERLRRLTFDSGADVVSFGATKNGLLFGEALIVSPGVERARHIPFVRKQAMQLHSKMRFIAAQFEAILTDDLWFQSAAAANRAARRLANGLGSIAGESVAGRTEVAGERKSGAPISVRPVEANGVFATVPPGWIEPLRRVAHFYTWDERRGEIRLMTAFDTTDADVDRFVDEARALYAADESG